MQQLEFKFFGWDEDPIGKYKQPEANTHPVGPSKDTGYPQTGINERVNKVQMRGTGAATKGKTYSECKED